MSTVNMAQALSSPSYAKSLWIDYYKNGNTKGITAEEIGQIEAQWKSKLASWKASVATDDNKYIIVDSSWDADIEAGKQEGRDLTGYEGSKGQKGWQITRSVGDGVVSVGGVVCRVVCKDAMQDAGAWVLDNAIDKVAKDAVKAAGNDGVLEAGIEQSYNNAENELKMAELNQTEDITPIENKGTETITEETKKNQKKNAGIIYQGTAYYLSSSASPTILRCISYAYFNTSEQHIKVDGSRYTGMLVRPVYSPNEYQNE